MLKAQAETQMEETKKIFVEVKQALHKKEEDMLKNIQALLVREQGLLMTRQKNNVNKIQNLTEFKK